MGKKHKKTPPALKKAAENKRYVSAVHGNKIYYTKEFYRAMYDAVHNGKGAMDAYASLGFDVRELGEDRAFAAARRAEQMSETGFAKMTDFDGTRARSEYGKLTPDEEIAYYKARNLYLEMLIKLEKKTIRIGGQTYHVTGPENEEERFLMVYQAYGSLSEKDKEQPWLSVNGLCRIMKCSTSGYYEWKRKYEDPVPSEKTRSDKKIKEKMLKVIKKLGHVPGTRTFRSELWRGHDTVVSRKRLRRLMQEMNLIATMPRKDAYKGQATHDHPCCALRNMVNQNFGERPRQVILTDITYLYHGRNRNLFYLCTFIDAYTREVLGWGMSRKMDVELVRSAYAKMKEAHGSELDKAGVLIHSDQGSQYTSTTFQQILRDAGFIQSVSRRGNSQDNAPMESFFGRLKTHILSLIALCAEQETAEELVNNYLKSHNDESYMYELAGLTPREFYLYKVTGIYPCESYYGIAATKLMPLSTLVEMKLEQKEKKRKKRAQKQAAENSIAPARILARDQRRYERKQKWQRARETSEKQLRFLEGLEEQIKEAVKHYAKAGQEMRERLCRAETWRETWPYDYVTQMKEMY